MAETLAIRSERARVPALAMAKGFGKYNPETERVVRKVEVVEDEALKQLRAAFKACEPTMDTNKLYLDAFLRAQKLDYGASDVENFSLALAEFQSEKGFAMKAGMFLSALINNGKDADYVVHTAHLATPIDYIGWRNSKTVTVKGDAGHGPGQWMWGGTLIIEGNAGAYAGMWMDSGAIVVKGDAGSGIGTGMADGSITVEGNASYEPGKNMKGGAITVKGDAGDWIGMHLEGGTITVEGGAGDYVGYQMKGGEIHLNGSYGLVEETGKIFHKGELIVGK